MSQIIIKACFVVGAYVVVDKIATTAREFYNEHMK